MLVLSGFNGFGQFNVPGRRERHFKDFSIREFNEENNLMIACAWSYAALADGKELSLKGFISGEPNSLVHLKTLSNITQISCCDRFCLILLDDGKLFKVLPDVNPTLQEVRLCFEEDFDLACSPPEKRSLFGDNESRDRRSINHIACGPSIAVAISRGNEVFNIPSKIYQFPKYLRIIQLVCGFEHALLLSGDGDVYSWGNGLRGQLGQETLGVEETPLLVEPLAGIKITHISAGGWHSAAISSFGDLYVWGFNSNGQLGIRIQKSTEDLREPMVYHLPHVIDLPQCCPRNTEIKESEAGSCCVPLRVFTGARHTVVQMSCGALHGAGWNRHGQLGLAVEKENVDIFKKIENIVREGSDMEIVCGAWNTILMFK